MFRPWRTVGDHSPFEVQRSAIADDQLSHPLKNHQYLFIALGAVGANRPAGIQYNQTGAHGHCVRRATQQVQVPFRRQIQHDCFSCRWLHHSSPYNLFSK